MFLVLSSLVSYFYYLRVIVVMYMRPAPVGTDRGAGLPAPAMTAVALAGVAVVLLFFAGSVPLGWAERSAASLWRTPMPQPVAAAPAR